MVDAKQRMKLPHLRRIGRAFYFDHGGKPRRWTPLGSDEAVALARYRRLIERKSDAGTIGALLDEFIDHPRPEWTDSTREMYTVWIRHLRRVFGNTPPFELQRRHVLAYLDTCKRTSAQGEISILRQVMERAVRRGLAEINPCVGARPEKKRKVGRTRYITDGELAAILAHARPLLQVAVRLLYLTGLRPGNLRLVRWDDFADGGSIQQQKTRKSGPRQRYELTDDLRDALDAARALQGRVATFTVLSERGRPIGTHRLGELWREACAKAGVKDAQLRDVRAKAATDADSAGQNAQRLLGHTTAETTKRYLRGREIVTVEPVRRAKT